jgi:hypothetical protein
MGSRYDQSLAARGYFYDVQTGSWERIDAGSRGKGYPPSEETLARMARVPQVRRKWTNRPSDKHRVA